MKKSTEASPSLWQDKVIHSLTHRESAVSLALCDIPMVSCFFHKLRVLRGKHYDTLGNPPSTYVCLLVGLFARTATYHALKEHLQGSWEGGYRVSASVIYVKIRLYIYEVDPVTRLLWRNKEWQSQLIPHLEDFWDRESILDPEEEDCGVHLAKYLLATEVGSIGLRQSLATE